MALLDNINLDFHVLSTGDPKILVVVDTSVWGFIEEKPSVIEITIPGSEKIKKYNFVKGKCNVFNSSNLFITPIGEYQDLSDGIYSITVKGSPDSNCKHRDFLKTDKARLELAKIYIDLGTDDSEDTRDKKTLIQDIELLIKSAEVLTTRGKLRDAMYRFKRAIEKINSYNECKECN